MREESISPFCSVADLLNIYLKFLVCCSSAFWAVLCFMLKDCYNEEQAIAQWMNYYTTLDFEYISKGEISCF